jgi:DNA-binding GntR family transcriptional regulator
LYELLTPLETSIRIHGIGSSQFSMAHLDLHVAINRAALSSVTSSFLERQAFLYPTDDYVQQPGHEPVAQHRALLDDLSSGDLERATTAVRIHALRGFGNATLDGPTRTFQAQGAPHAPHRHHVRQRPGDERR